MRGRWFPLVRSGFTIESPILVLFFNIGKANAVLARVSVMRERRESC